MGRPETALKEFKLAVDMNPQDTAAWMNLYTCYKEVGLMEDSQNAYKKYEALMEGPALVATGGENPANIPGGVSQTSKYAGGGDMEGNAPGMETLTDTDSPDNE
jgi:hypothetical protein